MAKVVGRPCTIAGCKNWARSATADWCERHYIRWYRHGDPMGRLASASTFERRYKRVFTCWLHPLADASGNAYVHRIVLYDEIGPGWHPCHWCGDLVGWEDTTLHVDHLNEVTDDNRIDNLVPSCIRCNTTRQPRKWVLDTTAA